MTSIDNNQSLNAILDKIGVNRQDEKPASKDTLGQADFLKLMTTQLQNQDPFAPMENAEFIAQMAQFSTVTGITEMGQSLNDISGQIAEFRLATATNMLGSSVLVPGNTARPDENRVFRHQWRSCSCRRPWPARPWSDRLLMGKYSRRNCRWRRAFAY
ncbi:MAG: flagellar hook capping FlgD N-terminal domain-containing protein [Rhodobiaceae bacterium]